MKKVSICILGSILFFSTACNYIARNKKVGDGIIQRIEEYMKVNDTLPTSFQEIGLNEVINGVLFCYERVDSVNYIVWFGTSLGEGVYYYSDSEQWEDKVRRIGE